jgi:predicted nucleotidyltransferase
MDGKERTSRKIEEILNKLLEHLIIKVHPEKIILFGSRAKELNRLFSDIDIAIEGGKTLTFRELRKLKEELDRIAGIYTVDLIFLKDVEEEFKKLVYSSGRILYEKGRGSSCYREA